MRPESARDWASDKNSRACCAQRDAFDAPNVGFPKIRDDVRFRLPSSTPHLPPARASRYAPCRTSRACALVPSRRARQAAETFTRNRGRGRMGRGLWRLFSAGGLLLGTLFFAAALTPTLLPRNFMTQGVLSGLSLAAGYGIGVFAHWLW